MVALRRDERYEDATDEDGLPRSRARQIERGRRRAIDRGRRAGLPDGRPRLSATGTAHLRVVEDGPLALVRRDMLPEHMGYRDTGCELSPSCLRCPLARCKYDEPHVGAHALALAARDREIALLRRRHRAPIDMLASTYGLSRRSVFRILRETRG